MTFFLYFLQAPSGSPGLALYEEGVRFGCWGMALFAICAALYSLVIERIIEYFRSVGFQLFSL